MHRNHLIPSSLSFHPHTVSTTAAMKTIQKADHVLVPDNVTLTVKSRKVTVTGPRGELTREFKVTFLHHKYMWNVNAFVKAERMIVCSTLTWSLFY